MIGRINIYGFFCRRRIWLISIVLLFAIIYSLISLVNHFQFRTYALDLGYLNQALYSLSRLEEARYTLDITGAEMSFFATHFSLIMFIYTPLYYLFGSYTLLVIQIIAILGGGLGIYKLSSYKRNSSRLSLVLLFYFYSLWGIFSALSFDFHNSVVAAMLIPWFILVLEKRKLIWVSLIFILIITARENMSLWMFFILLALLPGEKDSKQLFLKLLFLFLSISWFIIVNSVILPSIIPDGIQGQFGKYSHFGGSIGAIVRNILTNPIESVKLMFSNTSGEAIYDGIKAELIIVFMLSGGFALFFRPRYFIMLIPIFLQKLLSSDYAHWGINYHYSIEFAPILALAVMDFLSTIVNRRRFVFAVSIAIVTIVTSVSLMNHRKSKWYDSRNTRFYSKEHYLPSYNRSEIMEGLDKIGRNEIVAVSTELAPWLSSCILYHFPVVNDADYIAVLKNSENHFPLSEDEYNTTIIELRKSYIYNVIFESQDLLIFRQNSSADFK